MGAPRRDIFYNDFISPSGDRIEYIDGIKVPTPTDIGISEVPRDNTLLRESGRAFFRFFEAHEDRVQEIQHLGDIHLEGYKACLSTIEDLKVQLENAQAKSQLKNSKKCQKLRQKVRQKVRKRETILKTLSIHTAVARIAQCEGHIQYCEVAYNVYIMNNTRGGNDALALLVGELSMRSPYGSIELEMLKNVGPKRFRENRTKELREIIAARARGKAAAGESEGESGYETAKEEAEEEAEGEWEGSTQRRPTSGGSTQRKTSGKGSMQRRTSGRGSKQRSLRSAPWTQPKPPLLYSPHVDLGNPVASESMPPSRNRLLR